MTEKSPTEPPQFKRRPNELSVTSYAGIGLQFALGILLFLYLGKWIDARFATGPAGVIGGVFIGATVSFYSVYRQLTAAQKKDDAAHGRNSAR
jgi:F0F1-type ATP synthase assembly protein I